jgi:hypothetical protein
MGGKGIADAREAEAGIVEREAEAGAAAGRLAEEEAGIEAATLAEAQGLARAKQKLQEEESVATRDYRNSKMAADKLSDQASIVREEARITRQEERDKASDKQRRLTNERNDEKMDIAAEKALNTETRLLSNKINAEGIPVARVKTDRFFDTISEFEVLDENGQGTGEYEGIPGLGGAQNVQGAVGNATTFGNDMLRDATGSAGDKSGREVKQAYMSVLNQEVKDISGGAVPVAEWIRNAAAAGSTLWNEEMNAVDGVKAIRKALDEREQVIYQGYDPAAVEVYTSRTKPSGATEKTVSRTGKTADGRIVTEFSDGTRTIE